MNERQTLKEMRIVIIEMKVMSWGKILILKVKQQQKQGEESYVYRNESETRESMKLGLNAETLLRAFIEQK